MGAEYVITPSTPGNADTYVTERDCTLGLADNHQIFWGPSQGFSTYLGHLPWPPTMATYPGHLCIEGRLVALIVAYTQHYCQ